MNLKLDKTRFKKASDITIPEIFYHRLKTNHSRVDRIFGEGILPGGTFTVTGTPGAGKTTLLLQILEKLAERGYKTAYASGEECVEMLSVTCKRIGVKSALIANQTDINSLVKCTEDVDILIIDSFSSLTSDIKSSRAHEQYCIQELCKVAKKNNCAIGIVLHISKSGQYKGGTIIPHSVDTVIHLTRELVDGQPDDYVKCCVTKNRFGPTCEMSILMTQAGYDWDYIPTVEAQTPVGDPKVSRRDKEMELLLEDTRLTLKQAANKLNSVQRATYILRELVVLGKLEKTGRGEKAVYKKVASL